MSNERHNNLSTIKKPNLSGIHQFWSNFYSFKYIKSVKAVKILRFSNKNLTYCLIGKRNKGIAYTSDAVIEFHAA